MDGNYNIEQVTAFIINYLSTSCFNTNLSRNLIWHLLWLIISCVEKVVIIIIADTTYFIYVSFKKYSSMTECYVLWANNLIFDFITSISILTAVGWVLVKSEYLIFSCIGLNNEHPLSFVDVIEYEVEVETD